MNTHLPYSKPEDGSTMYLRNIRKNENIHMVPKTQYYRRGFYVDSYKSRDISIGIAVGSELEGHGSVRLPAGKRDFSLLHSVKTGSGAHPASCPTDTAGSFLGDQAAGG
jgi:hypothetical protein